MNRSGEDKEDPIGPADWRWDIRLLDDAARACCGRCASETLLSDQASHLVVPGVKVLCEASRVNWLMASRVAMTREEVDVSRA